MRTKCVISYSDGTYLAVDPHYNIQHSGYVGNITDDEYLKHFGIPGMKWGRRKSPQEIAARLKAKEQKKSDKANKKFEKRYNESLKYNNETVQQNRGAISTALFGAIGSYMSGRRTNLARGIDVKRLNPKNKKLMKDTLNKQIDFNERPSGAYGGDMAKYRGTTKGTMFRSAVKLGASTLLGPIGIAAGVTNLITDSFVQAGVNRLGRRSATKKMRKALKDMGD